MDTNQRISIFKWGTVLIVAVLFFMIWRGCKNDGAGRSTSDTVIVRDTQWLKSKTDTFYTPGIAKTEYKKIMVYKTDTLETFERVTADTAAILKDYLATRIYKDTIAVSYGKIYIVDTLSRNQILSRGVLSIMDVPVIKETVTIKKQRTIGYLGFEAMGNPQTIVYGVGASFGFKFKNDKYYGVKALMTRDGNPLYGFDFKIPIRFKKQ